VKICKEVYSTILNLQQGRPFAPKFSQAGVTLKNRALEEDFTPGLEG